MRTFYFLPFMLVGLYLACTAPVEQSTLTSQVSMQLLFSHQNSIYDLAWSPDSTKMAYQSPFAKISITQFSLTGNLIDTVVTFTAPYANGRAPEVKLSPDAQKLLYPASNKAYKIMSVTDQTTNTFTYPDTNGLSIPEWAPDSEHLYGIVEQNDDQFFLQIIHPDTKDSENILLDSLAHRPLVAKLTNDNWVLYSGSSASAGIHFWAKPATSPPLLIAPVRAREMTLLHDLNIIIYSYYDSATRLLVVAQYSLNDASTTTLSTDFSSISFLKRIPGENAIQFYGSHETDGYGLFRLSLSGEHQLLSTWTPQPPIHWLADGRSVAITTVEKTSSIYVYDLWSETKLDLTPDDHSAQNLHPTFSPDSRDIIFSKNGQLHTVSVQGGDARPLTTSGTPLQFHPEVSPDGSQIAFDDGYDLHVMPAAGGESQNLSKNVIYSLKNPTWSPDGANLACETQDMLIIFSWHQGQIDIEKMVRGRFEDIAWARKSTSLFGAPILARTGYFSFVMIDAQTGSVRNEFDIGRNIKSFCWAPNGREMAYSSLSQVFRTPILTTLK